MKAESFPDSLIPNTYTYNVRSYCYSAVIYSMYLFLKNRNFIFVESMYDSVIRQAENDLDACLHFPGIRDIGLFMMS